MTDRIEKLRTQSLNAINKISAERALLITEFYKSKECQQESIPVQRALSFQYMMEKQEGLVLWV